MSELIMIWKYIGYACMGILIACIFMGIGFAIAILVNYIKEYKKAKGRGKE